jgi:hypothetical protein
LIELAKGKGGTTIKKVPDGRLLISAAFYSASDT